MRAVYYRGTTVYLPFIYNNEPFINVFASPKMRKNKSFLRFRENVEKIELKNFEWGCEK